MLPSLSGAKPVAQMAHVCAREGKRVGAERDSEAIDESYHFRGIGNQIVSSFMKLRQFLYETECSWVH